jgi:hypothetical protein
MQITDIYFQQPPATTVQLFYSTARKDFWPLLNFLRATGAFTATSQPYEPPRVPDSDMPNLELLDPP